MYSFKKGENASPTPPETSQHRSGHSPPFEAPATGTPHRNQCMPDGISYPGGFITEPTRTSHSARDRSATPVKGSLLERVGAVLETGGSSSSTAHAQLGKPQVGGTWGGTLQPSPLGPRIQGIYSSNGNSHQMWRSQTPTPRHSNGGTATPMAHIFVQGAVQTVGAQYRSSSWGSSFERGRGGLGFPGYQSTPPFGPTFKPLQRSSSAQPTISIPPTGTATAQCWVGQPAAPHLGPLSGPNTPQRYNGPFIVPDTGLQGRYAVNGQGQVGSCGVRPASHSPSPHRQAPQKVFCQPNPLPYQFRQPQHNVLQQLPAPLGQAPLQQWQVLKGQGRQYMHQPQQYAQQQQQQQQQIHQLTAHTRSQLQKGPLVMEEAKFRRQLYKLRWALRDWPSTSTKEAIRTASSSGSCAAKAPEDWDAEDAKYFVSRVLGSHDIDSCLCCSEEDDNAWQGVIRGDLSRAAYGPGELPEALAHCAVGRAVKELEKIVLRFSQHLPPCSVQAGESPGKSQNSLVTSPISTTATAAATSPAAEIGRATSWGATTTTNVTKIAAGGRATAAMPAQAGRTAIAKHPAATIAMPLATSSVIGTTSSSTLGPNMKTSAAAEAAAAADAAWRTNANHTTNTANATTKLETMLSKVAAKGTVAMSMSQIPLPAEVLEDTRVSTSSSKSKKGGSLTPRQEDYLDSLPLPGGATHSAHRPSDEAAFGNCLSLELARGIDQELAEMRKKLGDGYADQQVLSSQVKALFQACGSPTNNHDSLQISDASWTADPLLQATEADGQNITLNATLFSEELSELERGGEQETMRLADDALDLQEGADLAAQALEADLKGEYSPQKTLPSGPPKNRICPRSSESGNIMPSPIPPTEASPYAIPSGLATGGGVLPTAPGLPSLGRHQQKEDVAKVLSDARSHTGASESRGSQAYGESKPPYSARSGEGDSLAYYRERCLELSSQVSKQDNEIVNLRKALSEARAQAAAAAASASSSSGR